LLTQVLNLPKELHLAILRPLELVLNRLDYWLVAVWCWRFVLFLVPKYFCD